MRKILILLSFCKIIEGALNPTPFFGGIQRVGYDTTRKYFDKKLFGDCYGIAFTRLRNTSPQGELIVVSDPAWHRILYMYLEEDTGQEPEWLRAYGERGSGVGQFDKPMGLCIDTTIYNGSGNEYVIYVADKINNRIVRLKYKILEETMVNADTIGSGFYNPTDVACVTKDGGGAYVVIIEQGNHRLSLYETYSNGNYSLIQRYGEKGPGVGRFNAPSGIAICKAIDGQGGYFIYITDTRNNRIVCLRFQPGQGITWEKAYKKFGNCMFLSVTASQYYCVYVTAFRENRVYVFAPGLTELLYEYGDDELLNGPKDVYIDWDRIGLTEKWTATTGIQYFKIIPEIRDFYPESDTFDALKDSVKINFKVCETAAYLTMTCCGDTIINNQYFEPGASSVYWDGREGSGKPAVPGTHPIYIRCPGHTVGTAYVTVKGTKITGEITDLHWTPTGNPYVLVENSYTSYNDTLTIDPGVLVMGHDANSHLEIAGVLKSIGTSNDTITFTSHRKLAPQEDSTYSGMWRGIVSNFNSAQSEIKFCRIEYANVGTEIWFDFQIPNNIIENCYFYTNTLPACCDFYSTGAFGYGNEYIDNDINKIILIEPPSDNPPSQNRPAGLNDITIKDQDIPFWFTRHYYFKYQVGGSEDEVMTLTIEPGVTMEFDDSTALEIGVEDQWGGYARGRLVAEGLENDSITFTGVDGGFWKGVRFCPTSCIEDTSVISYASIEYAGQDTASIVLGDSTSINIADSHIYKSKNHGFWMPEGSPYDNIVISNCLFEEDSVPIRTSFRNLGGIQTCTFVDNQLDAIEVVAGKDVVHRDITIHNYPILYNFLHDPQYGPVFSIYGNQSLATLTVEPGTYIHCDADIQINIGDMSNQDNQGKITALGDAQNQIVFTALNNKTPWSGIYLYSYNDQVPSTFDYCEISHAKDVGIFTKESSTTVSNSRITNCGNGIIVDSIDANPNITGNVITLNYCGVHNTNDGSIQLQLHNNDIFANKIALRNDLESYDIDAALNWFGDVTGPWDPTEPPEEPPDYNPAGRGDSIGDYIVYRPWLDAPIQPYQVTLIQPNGGDTLYGGSEYEIQWSVSVTPTRQELYFTTDFPEGGGAREDALWKFIDTVDVNFEKYVWIVPLVLSKRCRVAVKIYYEAETKGKETSKLGSRENGIASPLDKLGARNDKEKKADRNNMTRDLTSLHLVPRLDIEGKALLQNSKNEYESRNTNTISIDISDANFIILITTDISYGTAYNNASRIIRNPLTDELFLTYTSYDNIMCITSSDEGITWNHSKTIGTGTFPTLTLDSGNNPCCLFGRWVGPSGYGSAQLYYTKFINNHWTTPFLLMSVDSVYIGIPRYAIPAPSASIDSQDTIGVYESSPCPALAIDGQEIIHVVYETDPAAPTLFYRYRETGIWREKETIESGGCYYPDLEFFGDRIHLVWDYRYPDTTVAHELHYRSKSTAGWDTIMNIYEPLPFNVFGEPVNAGGWFTVWANQDIYYSKFNGTYWEQPETVQVTPEISAHPTALFRQDINDTCLYIAWTEGDSAPYTIQFEKITVPSVPRSYANLGQPIQSPYCLERDGYWIFGDKPYESVDYDNDSLVYKFTDLDPAKEYRLDLAYYFEPNPRIDSPPPLSSPLKGEEYGEGCPFKEKEYREGYPIKNKKYDKVNIPLDEEMVNENHQHDAESRKKGIGRLIQALVIDGVRLDSAFIVPHKLVRVSIWLPNELYADGEIIIEIEKIKGKVVVCGEMALYEFSGGEECSIANTRGGPQSNEIMHVDPIFFQGLYPNPAKRDLKVRLNSPDEREVTVKLYDVTGRLVDEIFNGKLKVGTNEIPIQSKKLAAGVYFVRLETSGYEKTEKIILVR